MRAHRFASLGVVLASVGCGGSSTTPAEKQPADAGSDTAVEPDSSPTCPTGYAECDGNPKSICETLLSGDPAHCGACGNACPAGAHQVASCKAKACELECEPGFADCNQSAADGCEAELAKNPQACGACERSCATSACIDSHCEIVTLASNQASPIAITVDATHVYWVNFANPGSVMRVAKTGGTPEELTGGYVKPYEVEIDGDDLYFTVQGTPPNADGSVWKMPKIGGTPVQLAKDESGASEMAVDKDWIFWVDTYAGAGSIASIGALAKDGALPAETLLGGEQHTLDIRVFQGKLYWLTNGTEPDHDDALLVRSDLDGKNRTVLVQDIKKPGFELGIEPPYLFFGSRTDYKLMRAPFDGGQAEFLAVAPGDFRSVEVAGGFVYFTGGTSGTVQRVSTDGGPVFELASAQLRAFEMVTDESFIYWSDAGLSAADGAIRKTAR